MSRSGGIPYHIKSLRFRKDYWGTHELAVQSFLEEWNPSAKRLILIGPSGGYSLPTDWLKRFDSVMAIEPDFIARLIFEKNHSVKPNWFRRKLRFFDEKPLSLFQDPEAAVLFCNLLGQIEISSTGRLKKILQHELEGREWASYHDALSGNEIDFDLEDVSRKQATLTQMRSWIYVRNPNLAQIEVNAHYAPDLFQSWDGLQFRYWQWRITPQCSHLIEGVFKKRQETDTTQ